MNYPNLKDAPIISLDIETHDPLLLKKGPGVYRKDGRILGVAVCTPDGFNEYYDIEHDHIRKEKNINYLKDQFSGNNKKLGANIMYDIDWLQNGYGIQVNGELHDVQFAEPLINEYEYSYSLEALGQKYLGEGKQKSAIDEYAESKGWKGDARAHLHKMPFDLVREYALVDTQLPLKIFEKQWEVMKRQELLPVYHMEIGLIPMLLQMRKQGVRVNKLKVLKNKNFMLEKIETLEKKLFKMYGQFNYNSTAQMSKIFDVHGIPYKKTAKGNPSIDNKVLAANSVKFPICNEILEVKRMKRTVSAVFDNVLLDPETCINGRIHSMFHPLRSDGFGTVSGRFSSTKPNLQQIPSKKDNYGPQCRESFIPEEGHVWAKLDYSQIEYRVFAHYASGPKSEDLRFKYNTDPSTDYHQVVMDWTGLERSHAKNLNFGTMYAMGINTCASTFGWTREYAKEVIDLYHTEMPYIKTTMNGVINVSQGRGYIKTLLKRRARASEDIVKHKKFYIMFNRLIQGSAADIMKKGMLDAYNAGIFNTLKPHLTVHDELDVSVPQSKEGKEALKELAIHMEECVQLKVPIKADIEVGSNWGNVSEEKAKEFLGD